tara:strand:+ start:257 stop:412 length:156 start_codon:yes stop_codon:yes gene_type:complete
VLKPRHLLLQLDLGALAFANFGFEFGGSLLDPLLQGIARLADCSLRGVRGG